MKQLKLLILLIICPFVLQAQEKVYVKDSFISHYMADGKLKDPFESTGKYHKKTRRKKGDWTEYSAVRDFEYGYDYRKKEPAQTFASYLEKAEGKYKDGKREGIWKFYLIEYGSLKPRLYKQETFVSGVKSGPFSYFFADEKKGIEGNYEEDKYQGPVMSYYRDGSKYGLRIYQKGKATGKHVYYFRDGTTRMVLFYLNDKKHGSQKTFYQGGVLKEEYVNKNGKTNGVYRFYHPNGKLWVEKVYNSDLLVNVTKLMDANGNPLEIGTIKNGNGTLNFYNSEGKIYAVKTYRSGVKVKTEMIP